MNLLVKMQSLILGGTRCGEGMGPRCDVWLLKLELCRLYLHVGISYILILRWHQLPKRWRSDVLGRQKGSAAALLQRLGENHQQET